MRVKVGNDLDIVLKYSGRFILLMSMHKSHIVIRLKLGKIIANQYGLSETKQKEMYQTMLPSSKNYSFCQHADLKVLFYNRLALLWLHAFRL